jgi:hypothetical protein
MAEYRMKEAIKIHLEGLKEGEIAILSKNPFRLDKGYEVFGTNKRFIGVRLSTTQHK